MTMTIAPSTPATPAKVACTNIPLARTATHVRSRLVTKKPEHVNIHTFRVTTETPVHTTHVTKPQETAHILSSTVTTETIARTITASRLLRPASTSPSNVMTETYAPWIAVTPPAVHVRTTTLLRVKTAPPTQLVTTATHAPATSARY